MLIYISHEIKNEKHASDALHARGLLESKLHSIIMPYSVSALNTERRSEIIRRCDAIYIIRDLEPSKLCKTVSEDISFCKTLEIPIYYHDEVGGEVAENLTELRCPNQVKEFMNVIMKMYRIHLKKNADYSPSNILGTGSIGVVVRMWDKMARIMNLVGFNLKLAQAVEYNPKSLLLASNEPLEDSFWDMAVYSVIKILLDKNAWGK
jgi:hypothetical protein